MEVCGEEVLLITAAVEEAEDATVEYWSEVLLITAAVDVVVDAIVDD